jgi:hypothetical protein
MDDRAIACYLKPCEEDRIQMLWGRCVIVEGKSEGIPGRGIQPLSGK